MSVAKKSSYPHSGSLEDGRRIQGEAAGLGVPARVGVSGDRGGDRETSPLQPRAESQAWPWAFACGQKVATQESASGGSVPGADVRRDPPPSLGTQVPNSTSPAMWEAFPVEDHLVLLDSQVRKARAAAPAHNRGVGSQHHGGHRTLAKP